MKITARIKDDTEIYPVARKLQEEAEMLVHGLKVQAEGREWEALGITPPRGIPIPGIPRTEEDAKATRQANKMNERKDNEGVGDRHPTPPGHEEPFGMDLDVDRSVRMPTDRANSTGNPPRAIAWSETDLDTDMSDPSDNTGSQGSSYSSASISSWLTKAERAKEKLEQQLEEAKQELKEAERQEAEKLKASGRRRRPSKYRKNADPLKTTSTTFVPKKPDPAAEPPKSILKPAGTKEKARERFLQQIYSHQPVTVMDKRVEIRPTVEAAFGWDRRGGDERETGETEEEGIEAQVTAEQETTEMGTEENETVRIEKLEEEAKRRKEEGENETMRIEDLEEAKERKEEENETVRKENLEEEGGGEVEREGGVGKLQQV
jgi:hypothetical protein